MIQIRENDRQKVLLFTEGGGGIGSGHVIRCLSLAQAFESKGVKPRLVIHGNPSLRDLVPRMDVLILDWAAQQEYIEENLCGSDIAVVDSYLAAEDVCLKISRRAGVVVFLDDYNRIDYPAGIVTNGSMGISSLEYPARPRGDYLLGPAYQVLRKEFWSVAEKIVREDIHTLMITFGGEDPRGLTPLVMRQLGRIFPGCLKHVVIGRGFTNVEAIESASDSLTRLWLSPGAAEMIEIMLDSDLAISAGGQTLGELARVGVPTIAVATAENQMTNIRGWSGIGFIQYAGWWEDAATIGSIDSLIAGLRDRSTRDRIKEIGKAAIDGKGAMSIAERAIERLQPSRGLSS